MEKKIECKIVQDLLLGYVDDVLNEESKKVVERHLSECDMCQKRLKEIQQDIENNEITQKKEIDYLKKIRIKNRIKSIFIAVGILFLIAFIIFLRNFIIVSDLSNKAEKSLASENYYRESVQRISSDKAVLVKEYYKDGKYKTITETYTDEGVYVGTATYATANSGERIEIDSENKIVRIDRSEFAKKMNSENNLKNLHSAKSSFIYNFLKALCCSIHTSYEGLGREYYVLSVWDRDKGEMWIDKETGLTLKNDLESNGTVVNYYPGTNIIKEEFRLVNEYRYEFDVVTDEDVTVPDYTGYEIKYINQDNFGL
ncbi:MAG: zf-HC2 domain-containing protein [Clostridia bacterium]|nr:zf-HC2 domain-containing protein [Clostridia bacterium]